MKSVDLTHHFLIAMPAMTDPYFAKTLTYICEHNEQGALGIVLNRRIDLDFQALFEQIKIPLENQELAAMPVHYGGPVQMDRGFVLHQPAGEWQSSLLVAEDVALTTSKDILEAVGRGAGPAKLFVSLGYAGWEAGQLEHELAQNAWLTVPATPGLIFDEPEETRLAAAMQMLGVDFAFLAEDAGHA
ncbi:MAG: YqgE/AlgH family protein [Sulfuricella sp.]